jgi:hypothetical protein
MTALVDPVRAPAQPGARSSTLPAVDLRDQERRARRSARTRHGFFLLLAIVLVLALLDVFGVRTGSVSARGTYSGTDLVLTVDYAEVSRPGLATPWSVTVEAVGGGSLPPALTLDTTAAYLDQFDENGLDPEPTETARGAEWSSWTFEPPVGATVFTVSFDARLEPGIRWGEEGSTRLVVDDRLLLAVRYRTWIWP